MKKNTRIALLGSLTLSCLASISANAVPMVGAQWTDTVYQSRYLSHGSSVSYIHDIRDDGFDIGDDLALFYLMTVDLFDNREASWIPERARVDMPGALGDTTFWTLSGTEFGGWSLLGLFSLNLTGRLFVTIESLLGNFWVGNSILHVQGFEPLNTQPTGVAEPGTLALFGLGLIAIAVARRRYRSSAI